MCLCIWPMNGGRQRWTTFLFDPREFLFSVFQLLASFFFLFFILKGYFVFFI